MNDRGRMKDNMAETEKIKLDEKKIWTEGNKKENKKEKLMFEKDIIESKKNKESDGWQGKNDSQGIWEETENYVGLGKKIGENKKEKVMFDV